MSPSKDEMRQAVLGRLSTYTEDVRWASSGADVAFADAVLELADRLRRQADAVTPQRRTDGSKEN